MIGEYTNRLKLMGGIYGAVEMGSGVMIYKYLTKYNKDWFRH
jgi:hypothetical protein